ncbi:MAG: ribose-phosphate diphosphokinase [Clostridiaceae bacterium]|nr:ribose-phosphate diphosphokinase [Clostridiaceae bacterium]
MTSSFQSPVSTERQDPDFRGYLLEPFGPIGIISHSANEEFAKQINDILYTKRLKRKTEYSNPYVDSAGYLRSDYMIQSQIVRFDTGEGKVTLNQTVRGHDIFIVTDVLSHYSKFSVFGTEHRTSPDDYYRDLLRIIMAVSGKARRINVIMPFLYEGRQDHRHARESLDCAAMLQQLYALGVANLIIFDPHDARIANAVPLMGIEMPKSSYKIISTLISVNPNLKINKDSMMVISPDETAISRSIFYSSMMGVPLGIFYRHKDYSVVIDGNHPVKEIRLLSDPIEGRDVLIIDDMINSGKTMIDTATVLKKEGAKDIYCIAPFGLFTEGIGRIQDAVDKKIIKQVLCTNLIYRRPELLSAPWYIDVNMTPFVARLIDAINVDESLSKLINPSYMISDLLNQMRIGELFE